MFARVSGGQYKPGTLDSPAIKDAIKQWREITVAQKKEGGKGGLLLFDRTTNKTMSISMWESEAAMNASEAGHKKRASRASADPSRVGPGFTEHYEIVAQV